MAKKDSTIGIFIFTGVLCLVCSLLVCIAVVALQPFQTQAKNVDREKSILEAAHIDAGSNVSDTYKNNIEARLVDLSTGEYVTDKAQIEKITHGESIDGYNFVSAAKSFSSDKIAKDKDIAKIGSRSKYMPVYLVKSASGFSRVVLPFYGQGLWSTMYGYLAVAMDGNTVQGVKYYDQGETPGLGGEVVNPKFTASWIGKKLFDNDGKAVFELVKLVKDPEHQIDALSGATLTSNGVTHSVQFWTDADGYGPYLKKLKNGDIK